MEQESKQPNQETIQGFFHECAKSAAKEQRYQDDLEKLIAKDI